MLASVSLHRLVAKLAGNRRDPVLLYKPGDLLRSASISSPVGMSLVCGSAPEVSRKIPARHARRVPG
jgi:hypothetical protein